MKLSRSIFAFLSALLLVVSCGKDDPVVPPDDGKDRESALQEKPSLKAAVEAMASAAVKEAPGLAGVEVWQEGYRSSGAWPGGSAGQRHQVWSVTKSFTSLAVGIAVGEGRLRLDEKVAGLFPSQAAAASKSMKYNSKAMTEAQKANMEAVTVEHLLTMTGGHRKDPTSEYAEKYALTIALGYRKYLKDDGVDAVALLSDLGTDIPELFFGYPFDAEPGTRYCYNSFGSCMLAEILKLKTGMDVADYLDERLFRPMGLDKPQWDKAGKDVSSGGWGLHLTTGEMVSFGRLVLGGGVWEGKRLVPEQYMAAAVSSRTDHLSHSGKDYGTDGYGYQFWTRKDGAFVMCLGLFGQYIIAIPSKQAVIAIVSDMPVLPSQTDLSDLPGVIGAFTGGASAQAEDVLELTWKYIVPAL